jgi:DNA-binding CsgD family transcriptional regulator
MPAHKAPAIQLSAEQEAALSALVRAHSAPQKLAERARIILLAAAGKGMSETAEALGVWRKTVRHWRRRWEAAASSADVADRLSEAPRCGAPATFTPEQVSDHGAGLREPRANGCADQPMDAERTGPSGGKAGHCEEYLAWLGRAAFKKARTSSRIAAVTG